MAALTPEQQAAADAMARAVAALKAEHGEHVALVRSGQSNPPAGRPSVYTREMSDRITDAIASGRSLAEVCRSPGMPHDRTVRGWVLDDRDGFAARYERARLMQADHHAEAIVEIADGRDPDADALYDPAKVRNRMEARWKIAGRMSPRRWGERVILEAAPNPLASRGADELERDAIRSRNQAAAIAVAARLSRAPASSIDDGTRDLETGGTSEL